MEKRCLVDIWRDLNPDSKKYTWQSSGNQPVFCRLDYFLITKSLKASAENSIISHGYRTDHSLVSIVFNDNYEKPGRGFWKLNVSLLSDINYVNMVKQSIVDIVRENNDTTPDILWETIKCVVRGDTIRYSVRKAKERNNLQETLEKDIAKLELQYSETIDTNVFNILEVKKRELETIYNYRARGAMIRSKARWVEDGEKNSNYFLNLEKRHFNKKNVLVS